MFDASKVVMPQLEADVGLIAERDKATFTETLGALIGQYEPVVTNFVDSFDREMLQEDPDFDVAQGVFDLPKEYHEYSSALLYAKNDQHLNYLVNRVDGMIERRQTIQNSTVGNVLLASFFDPINLISLPIGVTTGVAKSALRTGVATSAIVAGQEALFATTDPTKTLGEAAIGIGTAGIAGGALGGLAGFVKSKSSGNVITNVARDIDDEVEVMSGPADPTLAENWWTDSWAFRMSTSPQKRNLQNKKVPIATKQFHYDISGDNGSLTKAHQNGKTLGRSVHLDKANYQAEMHQLYNDMFTVFARADNKGVTKIFDYAFDGVKPRQKDMMKFFDIASRKRITKAEPANAYEAEMISLLDKFYGKWETRLTETGLMGTRTFYEKQQEFWGKIIARREEGLERLTRRNGVTKVNNKLTDYGKKIAEFKNKIAEYKAHLDEVNETVEFLKGQDGMKPPNEDVFFPRYWNADAISKNRDKLVAILADWYKKNPQTIMFTPESPITRVDLDTSPEAIIRRANETVDKIIKTDDEGAFENAFFGYGKSKHFMHRALDIPNELVIDFIHTNPFEVFMQYNARVAPRYAFAKKFDGRSFDEMLDEQVFDMMLNTKMDLEEINEVAANIRTDYDRVMNATLRKPHTFSQKAVQRLREVASLNYLGSAGIASISEFGRIMAEHGVGKTMKGLIARHTDQKVKLSVKEAAKAGEALEGMFLSAGMRFSDDLASNPLYHNLWEKGVDAFYILNGLTPITKYLKELDAVVRQDHIIDIAKRKLDGDEVTQSELEYVRRYDLDDKTLNTIAKANWERSDSGLIYANTDAWQSTAQIAAKEKLQTAMSSGILNTIMTATPADKPRLMDGVALVPMSIAKNIPGLTPDPKYKGYARIESPLLGLPLQFYSFTLAAVNKTTTAYTTGQMKSPLFGTMWMMGLAYFALELKSRTTKGGERAWDDTAMSDKLIRAFDYSGAAALYSDMFYTSMHTSMALTGKNYMEGIVSPKFPEEKSYVGAFTGLAGAGPSIAADYAAAMNEMLTGDLGEGTKDLARKLPYTKLWFISQLTNEFSSALGNSLDDDRIEGFRRY